MIKKYEQFCNEELNFKKVAAAGLLATTLATTSCSDKIDAKVQDTEVVSNTTFKGYTLDLPGFTGEYITFNVSPNNIIGSKWTVQQGKSSYNRHSITIPAGVEKIYFDKSTWTSELYADSNELTNADVINLSELKVKVKENSYTILEAPGWFADIDYIMVNQGYTDTKNNFTVGGKNFTYLRVEGSSWTQTSRYFIVPLD